MLRKGHGGLFKAPIKEEGRIWIYLSIRPLRQAFMPILHGTLINAIVEIKLSGKKCNGRRNSREILLNLDDRKVLLDLGKVDSENQTSLCEGGRRLAKRRHATVLMSSKAATPPSVTFLNYSQICLIVELSLGSSKCSNYKKSSNYRYSN